jgi:hypothetical protein
MKRFFLLLTIVLLCVIAGFIYLYPVKVQKKITVPYDMYKAAEQLNNRENFIKWYLPFAGLNQTDITKPAKTQTILSGDDSAQIGNISMFGASIKVSHKSNAKIFHFTTLSDSVQTLSSSITLSYKTTLFRKWFSKSVLEKNAEQSLDNLGDFMSDTKRFYGFDIQRVLVEDTSFLFSREVVPLKDKQAGTKKIFEKLIAFAAKNNADYTGNRIFYSLVSGDQVTLFASIGVTKTIATEPNGDIQYKMMPVGKNLLITNYQGPFGDAKKAFDALEEFKKDHRLSSMAIPYMKFITDGYDFSDEQLVQLKIYYPIF